MWQRVRRGEEKNIFPYQDTADVVFDTAMVYELSVLKTYAEPALFSVPEGTPEYLEAKRLLKCIRSNDYAFRIGGDEFMLILNGNLDAQLCEKRIERIKKLIGEPYEFDGHTIKIGISCGSAVYPDDADCAADIQNLADKRMYEDKKINHAQR